MKTLLIILLLGYCIFMLALTIVNESTAMLLYIVLVWVLGRALCKATNWMDKENKDAAD